MIQISLERPVRSTALPLLLLIGLTQSLVPAGDNFFERYYRDQTRETVVVPALTMPLDAPEGRLLLTEKQAIEMALQNNLDLNVERFDSLFSNWDSEALRGTYDSKFRFGFNWNRENTPTSNILAGALSLTEILTNYEVGFEKEYSTGTALDVSFRGLRTRNNNVFFNFVPAINTSLQVLFKQRLLEGFGQSAREYEIEVALNDLDISEQDFKATLIEIIFQVQKSYWELAYLQSEISAKQKSLEAAETVLEHNRARLESGTTSRLEVIEAEAEVAFRKEELTRVRFQKLAAQDRLTQLITAHGDPRQLALEVVPVDPALAPPLPAEDFRKLQAIALEQRPEYQKADLVSENQRVDLRFSRDRLKPSLDLELAVSLFGQGGNEVVRDYSGDLINPPIIDVLPGGVGDSFSTLVGGDFYGYRVGLNLKIPIENREARARNAQAQIALSRTELEKQRIIQAISLEIRNALTEIEMNAARLDSSSAAERLSRERLAGQEARFKVGLATTRDLIEAQRDLAIAESALIRVRTDLVKSHALLDRVVGRTLERHQIRLKEAQNTNVSRSG